MKLEVIIHKADEGGYWAELPTIRGCFVQGETHEEIYQIIHKAIELNLSSDLANYDNYSNSKIIQIWI